MFGSLDSMVTQLTSVGAPGGVPVDTSDPMVGILGIILLLIVCAGGAGAASSKKNDDKKYKDSEVRVETIDDNTVRVVEIATGKELFKGSMADARAWRDSHVERKFGAGVAGMR